MLKTPPVRRAKAGGGAGRNAGAYGEIRYGRTPKSVTLRDGAWSEVRSGVVLVLEAREKPGYTFLGWRDTEGGMLVDRFFFPDAARDTLTLEAQYEAIASDDGRAPDRARLVALNEVSRFTLERPPAYGAALYVMVDVKVPTKLMVSADGLVFYDGKEGANITYRPGTVIKICPSGVNLQVSDYSIMVIPTS